jgi:hypothetical protein
MLDAERVLEGDLFEDEVFRGRDLAGADLPAGNRLAGARVSIDVAVRLARSFGLEFVGS